MKKTLIMALAALPFMLTSCGDKTTQSQGTENQEQEVVENNEATTTDATSTDNLMTDENVDLDTEEEGFNSVIPTIRNKWYQNELHKVTNGKTADIEQFALAFCKEYPDYRANKEIIEYLKSPAKYEEEIYHIDYQKSNGYLSCMFMTEYDWNTTCCYWKRNNGHKLVAFWLTESHEGGDEEHLLAFYDYDPDSDTMIPEKYLTKMVDNAMKRYDTYSVRLPDKGKDIGLSGYTIDREDDSAECADYTLRWNGYDFDLK